jgi:hypothetical protein
MHGGVPGLARHSGVPGLARHGGVTRMSLAGAAVHMRSPPVQVGTPTVDVRSAAGMKDAVAWMKAAGHAQD